MYYLLYGTDSKKARAKLHELIDSLVQKKKDASVVSMNEESFDVSLLESFISGQGLFESKQVATLDNVFALTEAREAVLGMRKELGGSPNIFFILEGELDKATLTKLEKHAEKALVFGESMAKGGTAKERSFNTFSLGDALGARDRKKLWVLYMKGRRANIAPEELHGILFWQAKSMLLTLQSKNAGDAGLNPFVYKKASSFLRNYSEEELRKLLHVLVALPHDARRGFHDLDTSLERFILSL